MTSMDLKFGMIFFFQVVVGILGNLSLLYHYIFLYLSGCRAKSTYLILIHLAVANSLVLTSKGIPETMAAFGMKYFFSDFGCKFVFYVHRVSRGVSIGTVCLLSVFQAITISPKNFGCAELKVKTPKYIGSSNILCWILHMLLSIRVPIYIVGKGSHKNITGTSDLGYCFVTNFENVIDTLYIALTSFPDVLCLGLMILSSGFMIFILYGHKQQVKHIHGNTASHRPSPEARATKSIFALVSTFVSFYSLSSFIYIHFSAFDNNSWWLVKTFAVVNSCFPAVSPFILLSCNPSISRLCCVCCRRNMFSPSHQKNLN